MATAREFVEKCLEEVGDEYEMGAEVQPGTSAGETTEWDCSELVQVKLNELGIDAPDGSTAQLNWCTDKGTIIPLDEGKATYGALLLRVGHVAVSLGNGETVEAMGEAYGVLESSSEHRTFTHAGLVPGLDYSETVDEPEEGMEIVEGSDSHTYIEVPEADEPEENTRRRKDRRPRIKNGSKGGAVRFIQKKLKALGKYKGKIDGIFGPITEAAVKAFQDSTGLTVDGEVGSNTWNRTGRFRRRKRRIPARQR